jgi:hypothetical protein
MRKLGRALAAVCVSGAVAMASGLPAGGQEVDEFSTTSSSPVLLQYGWWNKAQQIPGTSPVPPPPNAPADGIYIVYDYEAAAGQTVTGPIGNLPQPPAGTPAARPLGPSAFGAVRFSVPDGSEGALTLKIVNKSSSTPGGIDPAVGALLGCLVTSAWDPVQNGRYESAPRYDCSSAASATINGDAIDLQIPAGLVQNGTIDLALVPTGSQPYSMSIDRPSDSSLVLTNVPESAAGEFGSEDFAFEDPLTTFMEGSGAADFSFDGGDSLFSTGVTGAAAPAASPARRGGGRVAVPAGRVSNPFDPDASRGERLMAVALLLMMGAGLWWIGGQPTRAPRLLGSLAGRSAAVTAVATGVVGTAKGIGRFARPRTGEKAPRLF